MGSINKRRKSCRKSSELRTERRTRENLSLGNGEKDEQ